VSVSLAPLACAACAEGLARQLHLIYDGASLSARMDHDPSAAVAARAAAAVLLDAALGPARAGHGARSGPAAGMGAA
jgi:hypothetical protein